MRLQTFFLINFQLPLAQRYSDPRKLMPFNFDEEIPEEDVYFPSEEEWEALDEKYAKKHSGD